MFWAKLAIASAKMTGIAELCDGTILRYENGRFLCDSINVGNEKAITAYIATYHTKLGRK